MGESGEVSEVGKVLDLLTHLAVTFDNAPLPIHLPTQLQRDFPNSPDLIFKIVDLFLPQGGDLQSQARL